MSKMPFPFSRRQLLQAGAMAGAGLLFPWTRGARAQAVVQTPLAGKAIAQFVDPLPLLSVAGGPMQTVVDVGTEIEVHMREFLATVMPSTFVPAAGTYGGTWVWGYIVGPNAPVGPQGTYIGPVVVATRGVPTQMKHVNDLGTTAGSRVLAYTQSTDQTLHWADPAGMGMGSMAHYDGPIPACVHLHGGEVPPGLDGGPDAWYLSQPQAGYTMHGHGFYSKDGNAAGNWAIYRYPNCQEAAPIWFHDHTLGATRLNVYAGLAGAYAIVDPGLTLPTGLHPVGLQQGAGGAVDYIVPVVIQDRMFDVNGQFYFPNMGINPTVHPYWIPEFVGDTIVVNGKVWPFMSVQARRYRFLFLNGSNARTYELFLVNTATKAMGPPMWQIATDGGYLDAPVKIDPNAAAPALQRLTIMPGERADVIIDFATYQGQTLVLRNTGRTPYPKGAPPGGSTIGQIMQFRVQPGVVADASYNPASGIPLRSPMIRLVTPATGTPAPGVVPQVKRQLTLNEVIGPLGPLEVLVNNTRYDGVTAPQRPDFTPITVNGNTTYYSELPTEGTTELWEIINLTADAHPIHTHLTQFQLLNRQNFSVSQYNGAYGVAFPGGVFVPGDGPPLTYTTPNVAGAIGGNPDVTPFLQGRVLPPAPNEAGWKDTIIVLPGQVTRLLIRYAPTDVPVGVAGSFPFDPNHGHGFVWHCHIIDHEDNEMMRPYTVIPTAGAMRTYLPGTDY